MTFWLTSVAASRYIPAASSRLTSGSASRASGFTGSYGRPDHSVSSLSCSRSCTTPPNTMAPRRPLPTGSAPTHSLAGARYQRVSGESGGGACPVRRGAGGAWRAGNTAPARIRIPARVVAAIERRVAGAVTSSERGAHAEGEKAHLVGRDVRHLAELRAGRNQRRPLPLLPVEDVLRVHPQLPRAAVA